MTMIKPNGKSSGIQESITEDKITLSSLWAELGFNPNPQQEKAIRLHPGRYISPPDPEAVRQAFLCGGH